MKRLFLLPLVILLVCGFIFASCAAPAPAPAPALTPTSAPAPASAPAKPIKLKLAHPVPTYATQHVENLVPWTKLIKERTAAIGKPVDIVIYGAGALGTSRDMLKLAEGGVADITASWTTAHDPGIFPLNDVMTLPLLFASSIQMNLVAQEMYDTRPEFRKEFERHVKLLFFCCPGAYHLVSKTRQVKTLEDFKGMKTPIDGPIQTATVTALGGTPVEVLPPEAYMSLERGLLDAGILSWEGIVTAFKWLEVTKYRTIFPRGLFASYLVATMNWDSWNRLPPDVQKIFEELTGTYMSRHVGETFDRVDMQCLEKLKEYDKKAGNPEPYYMPKDEFQKWEEAIKPLYEKWIADLEAKGLPGRSLYEDTLRLIEKYSE